eukprot:symbB.v1.2.028837.t1/scaffold3094.1/size63714/7
MGRFVPRHLFIPIHCARARRRLHAGALMATIQQSRRRPEKRLAHVQWAVLYSVLVQSSCARKTSVVPTDRFAPRQIPLQQTVA